MEAIIGGIVLAWIVYELYKGYQQENAPPLPMVETSPGVREPVCPHCRAKLVTLTRSGGVGFVGILAWLVIAGGCVAILINWIVGGILLIIGILLAMVGKKKTTVLTCPACGKDAKTLS